MYRKKYTGDDFAIFVKEKRELSSNDFRLEVPADGQPVEGTTENCKISLQNSCKISLDLKMWIGPSSMKIDGSSALLTVFDVSYTIFSAKSTNFISCE